MTPFERLMLRFSAIVIKMLRIHLTRQYGASVAPRAFSESEELMRDIAEALRL